MKITKDKKISRIIVLILIYVLFLGEGGVLLANTLGRQSDTLSPRSSVTALFLQKTFLKKSLVVSNTHTYVEVEETERTQIYNQIARQWNNNREKRLKRFLRKYNASANSRASHINFAGESTGISFEYGFREARVFHHGLFKDEEGGFWILKKKVKVVDDDDEDDFIEMRRYRQKNFSPRERLAYLIAKDRANFTEIRLLNFKEASAMGITEQDKDKYYLTRVTTRKDVRAEKVAHKDIKQAFSSLFVAYIFLRKIDPFHGNVVYADNLPVAIDHDEILRYDLFFNKKDGFNGFATLFMSHFFFRSLPIAPYEEYRRNNNLKFECKLRKINEVIDEDNYSKACGMIRKVIEEFGLSEAFMVSENLDEEYIRQSILEFKQTKNARKLAKQAGYKRKKALDSAVRMIESNKDTLGRDVNEVLKLMTGEDYGLDKLDVSSRKKTRGLKINKGNINLENIVGMAI